MEGIFGDLFDIDGDGKLDSVEQAADYLAFDRMMNSDDDDDVGEDFDCEQDSDFDSGFDSGFDDGLDGGF